MAHVDSFLNSFNIISRVRQLADETKTLSSSLTKHVDIQYKQSKYEEERAKLLERRKVRKFIISIIKSKNQNANIDNSRMQNLMKDGQSLDSSLNMAIDIESTGVSILGSITQQNEQIMVPIFVIVVFLTWLSKSETRFWILWVLSECQSLL
jgi:hypothetical protein